MNRKNSHWRINIA